LHASLIPLAPYELTPRLEQILDRYDIVIGMSEDNSRRVTPPQRVLPVIEHCVTSYKLWQKYRNDFPKGSRYTLGDRIDTTFLYILEMLFIASYQSKSEKLPTIASAVRKTDILKFLLRVAWEIAALDDKKYATLSAHIDEVGRMIGGWKKGLESKTPAG
jgi:hypothetical protein